MSQSATILSGRETAVLQFYHFKKTFIQLIRKEDKYFVILRKYRLLIFRSTKIFEFPIYNDAEDMYLELKLNLLFREGASGIASYS